MATTDDGKETKPSKPRKLSREEKLAKALRENLRRRKAAPKTDKKD